MTRRAGLYAVSFLCLLACREAAERTQTVIVVDAERAVQDAVVGVTVKVTSLADGTQIRRPSQAELAWPMQFAFTPLHGDASRSFEMELTLHRQSGHTDADLGLRVRTGFIAGATRYASVLVQDSCLDSAASCTNATCNEVPIATTALSGDREAAVEIKVHCVGGPPRPAHTTAGAAAVSGNAGEGGEAGEDAIDEAGGSGSAADGGAGGARAAGAGGMNAGAAGAAGGGAGAAAGSGGGAPACGKPPCDPCEDNPCRHGECSTAPAGSATAYSCECDPGYELHGSTCRIQCGERSWRSADGQTCTTLQSARTLSASPSVWPCRPEIAFNSAGNGLAAWLHSSDTDQTLWFARYVVGEGWKRAVEVPAIRAVLLSGVRVALDDQGTGLVIWTQPGEMHRELWYARYDGTDALGKPTRLAASMTGDVMFPAVALDASGSGFVTWTALDSTRTQVWVKRFIAASASFTASVPFSDGDERSAMWSRIATDNAGGAHVVWTTAKLDTMPLINEPRAFIAHFDPKLGWGSKTALDPEWAFIPDVATAPDGASVVIWEQVLKDPDFRAAAQHLTGATLSPKPGPLSTARSEAPSVGPTIAISTAGEAVATWTEVRGGLRSIWGSTSLGPSAAWATPTKLNAYDWTLPTDETNWFAQQPEPPVHVALDANGNGFAVGTEYDENNARVVWLRRVEAQAGFSEPIMLQSDQLPNVSSFANVAVDPQGRAAVILDRQLGAKQYVVETRRVE